MHLLQQVIATAQLPQSRRAQFQISLHPLPQPKVRLWDLQCVTSVPLHRASSLSPNSSQETAETRRVRIGWRRYSSWQSKSYRGWYQVKGTHPWLFYPWAIECRYEVGAGFYILDSPRSVFSGRFSWSLSSHLLAIHLFLPFFYIAETHPQITARSSRNSNLGSAYLCANHYMVSNLHEFLCLILTINTVTAILQVRLLSQKKYTPWK